MKRAMLVSLSLSLAACESFGGRAMAVADAGQEASKAVPSDGASASVPPPYTCESFHGATVVGTLDTPLITEASGLVASRRNSGILWTLNDSGNAAKLYAITRGGALAGTYTLQGARNVDWEDLGIGPARSGEGDVLYVADIGDNNRARSDIGIYWVAEPSIPPGQVADVVLASVKHAGLLYPGGEKHNAETLLVDQASGDLVVITRELGRARLFRARADALVADATITLEATGVIPLSIADDAARGGSAADTGEAAALRTTYGLLLFTFAKGTPLVKALEQPSCALPTGAESRGETVAFAPGATGYYTLAEGANNPLYYFERR